MKALFTKKLPLIVLSAITSFSIISCKDDDDLKSQLEIDNNIVSQGIESEIDGKIFSFNISSYEEWTISIPEDAEEWLYISNTSGKGDQNVLVSIDANFGSSSGRSTTITINSGDIEKKILVSQVPTFNGQSVANASGDISEQQIASTKGVGMGFNVTNLKTLNKPIINSNAIKILQENNPLEYSYIFSYNKNNTAKAAGAIIDSVETKKDSLGASLSFDINYAKFKMNIGGRYHGDESMQSYKSEYKYGATYSIANTYMDLESIMAYYEDASSDAKEKMLLTAGFKRAKENIEKAYKKGDTINLNKYIENLFSQYGAGVVTGCELGGSLSLWMKYNRDSIAEVMGVDSAHVTASINAGLLKISANVNVDYQKKSITILENSAFKYEISGGSAKAQNDLGSILSSTRKQGDSDSTYGNLHKSIDNWINSLNANSAETLSQTRLEITPIWYLFDYDLSDVIMSWYKKNHKDDKLDIIKYCSLDTSVK